MSIEITTKVKCDLCDREAIVEQRLAHELPTPHDIPPGWMEINAADEHRDRFRHVCEHCNTHARRSSARSLTNAE